MILLTVLYTALVILNPYYYLGEGNSAKLLAIDHITNNYSKKNSAIQLIGTTIIAIGIIISQEKRNAQITTLTGTLIVWIGLTMNIKDNQSLFDTTLLIFPITVIVIAIGFIFHKLAISVITWLKKYTNLILQRAMDLTQPIRNSISERIVQIWQTIGQTYKRKENIMQVFIAIIAFLIAWVVIAAIANDSICAIAANDPQPIKFIVQLVALCWLF